MKDTIDSSFLDRAIIFAVKAHANVERRNKGFPYVIHPLEAVTIVATMSNDQELLAAAALHDVIEDTDITYEDIQKEFGTRVADLVQEESDEAFPDLPRRDSWKLRKEKAIEHLACASKDAKIVALGDKLSNMRAIYRDFQKIGQDIWNQFNVTDPALHQWHYRGLAASLADLSEYGAYQEFVYLLNKVFPKEPMPFSYRIEANEVFLSGKLNHENILALKEALSRGQEYLFDFAEVSDIDFGAMRAMLGMKIEGYSFLLREVSEDVARKFEVAGLSTKISILRKPVAYNPQGIERFGEGCTAESYYTKDGDAIIKIYGDFVKTEEIEKEKRYATSALLSGISTPICGDIVKIGHQKGIIFERVKSKISFAKKFAEHPEEVDAIAKDFASLAKSLHATPCDTSIFPDAKKLYHHYIDSLQGFTEEELAALHRFIEERPEHTTCLHGDFHTGNAVIAEDGQKLWIDMGGFSYGDPLFDIGTLYYVTHGQFSNSKRAEELFHTSNENLYAFYQAFIKHYFDNKSEEELEPLLLPYAALNVAHFAFLGGQKPYHAPLIRKWFFGGK